MIPLSCPSSIAFHDDKTLVEVSCLSRLWRNVTRLPLQLRSDDMKRIFSTIPSITKTDHVVLFLYPYDLCFRNPRLHLFYCLSTWHIRTYQPEHTEIFHGTNVFEPISTLITEQIKLNNILFFHIYIIRMNLRIRFLYYKARLRHGGIGLFQYHNHMDYQKEYEETIK